jgi:NAD(P)-dependent dehydrogenase (short-subunit alcohol dehydrogenase family)
MVTSKREQEVVVVTGASAGVGRATVRAFARQGARIGLLARGQAGLDGARRDVEELGGKALVLPTDVSNAEQVEAAATAVTKEFGPIDVWINDAMCSVFSPAKKMTPEDYKRVTDVTYLGVVYGTLAALQHMLPRNRGTILQVGSALAYRGIPLQSAYCGAKHAIQGFTESVRCELIHDQSDVKITMVQMPALNTPQFDWVKSRLPRKPQPVPPIYQPEVAADAIFHAAHNYRREWFVGGPTVIAIQGNKLAPRFGDWYLGHHCYEAQQCDEATDPHRRNNLYEPVDDVVDHGAHGDFDARSHGHSLQLWADQHRRLIAISAVMGSAYEVLVNGRANIWRGGLIGASVATLAALVLGRRNQQRTTQRLINRHEDPQDALPEKATEQ